MKKIKIIFINLIIFFVLSEATLFVYYAVKYGQFVDAAELYTNEFNRDEKVDGACRWGDSIGLHRYFEIYYPKKEICTMDNRNNYGLLGRDIPFEKDNNFYNIVVAGGSVAEQIGTAIYENRFIFEDELNKHWQSPTKKPFRVINIAMAASRQPTIAIQILLFNHVADQIISIEGYNEHFRVGGFQSIEAPTFVWSTMSMSEERPLMYWSIRTLAKATIYSINTPLKFSYTVFTILNQTNEYLKKAVLKNTEELKTFPDLPSDWSAEKRTQYYLARYSSYVVSIDTLLKEKKIPYTLFIQPIPQKFKILTESERKTLGSFDVLEKFEMVEKELLHLKRAQIHVENLTDIFKDNNETLYIDNIHTNNLGLEIMAKAIAERLAHAHGWRHK